MKTELLTEDHGDRFERVSAWLMQGLPVALPTETVYGLGADASNPKAIASVFEAKERPLFDPLIVHLPSSLLSENNDWLQELSQRGWIDISAHSAQRLGQLRQLSQAFWPGPLTLVLPKGKAVNELITGGLDTVALRVPAHPHFQKVLQMSQTFLCAPSANRFQHISPTRSEDVLDELSGRIPGVLDGGACAVGVESTVLSFPAEGSPSILRHGQVSAEHIKACIDVLPECSAQFSTEHHNKDTIDAPGQMLTHYAPNKPFFYLSKALDSASWPRVQRQLKGLGQDTSTVALLLTERRRDSFLKQQSSLGEQLCQVIALNQQDSSSSNEIDRNAAKELFGSLRQLEQGPAKLLLCDPYPQRPGIAHAIRDRLLKATSHRTLDLD